MSTIRAMCPSCRRTGKVPREALGRTVKCPACGTRYTLTEMAPAAAPPAEEELLLLEEDSPPPSVRPVARPPQPQPQPQPVAFEPDPERKLPLPAILIAAGGGIGVLVVAVVAFVFWPRGKAEEEPAVAVGGLGGGTISPVSFNPFGPAATDLAKRINDSLAAENEPGEALPTAEIVARCEPSVALIKGKISSGTGFLVAPGLLATNAHVIDDEFIGGIEVRFPSAAESQSGPFTAELLYEDAKRDLAFLSVNTSLPALKVAKSYKYRKGEDITVIGNPGDGPDQVLENAISRGVMSTRANHNGLAFYQLNISVNPGNSGGPVFDSTGRVIGVITLKSTDKEAVAFCIPLDDLRAGMSTVGTQAQKAVDQTTSKHRLRTTFKTLVQGGAMYVIGIFVRRSANGRPASKDNAEDGPMSLEKVIDEFDQRLFVALPDEVTAIKSDTDVPQDTQRKIESLWRNFSRLKEAYGTGGRPAIADSELNSVRASHLRLAQDLSKALDIEVPEHLLLVLQPQQTQSPDAAFRTAPRIFIPRPPPARVVPGSPRRPGPPTISPRSPRSRLRPGIR